MWLDLVCYTCVCVWFFAACSFFIHFAKDFWSLNVSSLSIIFRNQSTDEHKQVQRQNSNWISIFKVINRHMALKSSEIIWQNSRMRLSMMRSIIFYLNAAIFFCCFANTNRLVVIADFNKFAWVYYGHKYSTQFSFMWIKPIMSANDWIQINDCVVI